MADSGSADMVMVHMLCDLFLWDWDWRPSVVANNNPITVHVFFGGGYTLEGFKIMHSEFSSKKARWSCVFLDIGIEFRSLMAAFGKSSEVYIFEKIYSVYILGKVQKFVFTHSNLSKQDTVLF